MITPRDAADAVTYLVAAGATTARDAQGPVWADYLNDQVPGGPDTGELRPACRAAIRAWQDAGRAWQINVEHLAQAIRRGRSERIRAEEDARGPLRPAGLDHEPDLANRWIQAARRAVGTGQDRAAAEQHAWRAIGRQPPPPEISMDNLVGREKARAVLAAIAARKGIPR
ncbi:hypothetical protein [Actinomyces procaprae]|uniref:hypothetical protein n=1 Tax=Actinomyces procaprae TaxID=2560010 RepID=UPI0010A28CE8|nr:hypothetical protein [Actinomyces procaprae]